LILIDGAGCKVPVRGTDTIRVFDIQTKGFANNSLLCDSGKVSFKDTSVTNDVLASSQWSFGDNTTGTGITVTHGYTTSGSYYATLVDVTAHGCTDTLTFATPIKVVESPMISITSATSFCVPATISMKGNIVKPDTSLLAWSWNFGNGALSTVQNPTGIAYPASGNYNIVATATNSSGCKGVSNAIITVHSLPLITAGKDTSICRNTAINLQAAGALTYVWANATGISCTACSSPMVAPDSTSIYAVTGTDQYGCTATDSVTVSVTQPVKVSVSNTDTLCNGDYKQLTASGAQAYKWYPAIYLSNAATAQPTFHASKDTSITYTVIGFANNNCFADTTSVKVKVYPIPEMRVAQSAITADAGTTVQLSTVNSADVTKWKWSPAMYLTNPNIPNPVAQPRESITYTVVAANDGACVTRAQIAVTVTCGGSNVFVPNTFSPNGDGVNDKFYARGTGLYNIKSFRIFNRWGQLVYEKLNGGANNAEDGWDGTVNGQPAPSDVYVYMIEVMCINDTVVPIKGNVTLLR
jgi:gliding motility-associated-like protein